MTSGNEVKDNLGALLNKLESADTIAPAAPLLCDPNAVRHTPQRHIELRALSPVVVTLISLPFFGYAGGQLQLAGEILVIISIIAMGMTQKITRRIS